ARSLAASDTELLVAVEASHVERVEVLVHLGDAPVDESVEHVVVGLVGAAVARAAAVAHLDRHAVVLRDGARDLEVVAARAGLEERLADAEVGVEDRIAAAMDPGSAERRRIAPAGVLPEGLARGGAIPARERLEERPDHRLVPLRVHVRSSKAGSIIAR